MVLNDQAPEAVFQSLQASKSPSVLRRAALPHEQDRLAGPTVFHHKLDAVEAHLITVFTRLALSREIQTRSDLAIRNLVRSAYGHWDQPSSRSTAPSKTSHRRPPSLEPLP